MYYWVLVVTLTLNGVPHTVTAERMQWLTCTFAASALPKMTVHYDTDTIVVVDANCEKRFLKEAPKVR